MIFKNHLEYSKSSDNFFVYHNISRLYKKVEALIFILLAILLIVTSRLNNQIANKISFTIIQVSMPVAYVVAAPFNAIFDLTTNFHELLDAKEQNSILLQENSQLKALYTKNIAIYQEYQQLKQITKYFDLKGGEYQTAKIIANPSKIYSQNAFINIGSDQNIQEDNIVISNNNLIGRIAQTDNNKSRILLITDINSRIPIIAAGSGTKGILAGNNSNIMQILYLEKDHKIKKGDLIFTALDGDTLPPGLLAGIVTKTGPRYAEVKMAKNIQNVDLVSVIRY